MEKKHRCKVCLRSFGNGKALGGHMRSHMMKLPKRASKHDLYFWYEKEESVDYHCKKGDEGLSILIPDGESEADSPACNGSKRVRMDDVITEEEHVAHCLIMLSRDCRDDLEDECTKKKKVFKCDECEKAFASYQALGGHKASHNKVKVNPPPPPPERIHEVNTNPPAHKLHHYQCPFCHKVFLSGQALGGHKRSHFIAGTWSPRATIGCRLLDIDLNLPAMAAEDDGDSLNASASALTDAD